MTTVAPPTVQTVPLLDLKAQYASIKDDIDAAIRQVVESQTFILGPVVERFEQAVAELSHTRYAVACASGTDALLLALRALRSRPPFSDDRSRATSRAGTARRRKPWSS